MNSTVAAVSLDHVGYVADSLPALRAAMQRLGFAPTQPTRLMRANPQTGALESLQQESCHAVFGRSYIEFSAVLTADPAHHLAPYRARGDGLHILALGAADVAAAQARCVQNAVLVTAPARATRRIDYGSLHGEACFEWFMVSPESAPEGLICWVRNLTPQLVFQPEVSAHPNGALDVVEVQIESQNPEAAAARYAAWLGIAAARTNDGLLFDLEGGRLRLRAGTRARYAGVVVRVQDLAACAGVLRAARLPIRAQHGQLTVPATFAGGAVMVFAEGPAGSGPVCARNSAALAAQ
jgi:Glyoxalase-like domain